MRKDPAFRSWLLRLTHFGARAFRKLRPYYVSVLLAGITLVRAIAPRSRTRSAESSASPENILVIRMDAIGDLVMSTLVFRELKRKFPAAKITAVVQSQARSLIETSPFVDRILSPRPVSKIRILHRTRQDWAMLSLYRKELQNESFSVVLNPRAGADLYSADILIALVDSPRTYKYYDDYMKGLAQQIKNYAFRKVITLPRVAAQHEVVSDMKITEKVTGQSCLARPEIFLTDADLQAATSVLANLSSDVTIISVAFTAQAPKRAWPLIRWAEVVNQLGRERPVFAVLICARAEEHLGQELMRSLSVPSHLMSGSSLRHVAAVLKQSHLFIGPDSGIAHTAAAMDCPVVVVSPHPLDGDPDHGNSPLRFGPYSSASRVIQPLHALHPCTDACDAVDPHCILQVQVGEVLTACRTLLSQERKLPPAASEALPSAVGLR